MPKYIPNRNAYIFVLRDMYENVDITIHNRKKNLENF